LKSTDKPADRAKIIERVLKLRALARGSSNENEKKMAAKRAIDLMEKHGLTTADLEGSGKTAAFDKLVDVLGEYTAKHPDLANNTFGVSKIIEDVLGHAKTNLPQGRKVVLLDQLSQGLKIARVILGNGNRTLNDVSGIVESVVKTFEAS
jgi:hypothetical protein